MNPSGNERELLDLIWLACEGTATVDQMAELSSRLADPGALRLYVEYVAMHADLHWDYDEKMALPVELPGSGANVPAPRLATFPPTTSPARSETMGLEAPEETPHGEPTVAPRSSQPSRSAAGGRFRPAGGPPSGWPSFVAAALVAAVMGAGLMAWWINSYRALGPVPLAVVPLPSAMAPSYSTRLVNVTNCRWDMSRTQGVKLGDELTPGQSLILLEGIAEIATSHPGGGTAQFVLEGPLSLIVTQSGLPVLEYGKLSGVVSSAANRFAVHTPMGTMTIADYGAFGIAAAPSDVTIHAFLGEEIEFEPLQTIGMSSRDASFRVPEGTSLRVGAKRGELHVDRGDASERSFIVNVSTSSHNLAIPEAYVEAVRKAKPLAYWRFEHLDDEDRVKNEMADRWHCLLKGDVGWRDYAGNRTVEFGVASNPGQFTSDEPFGELLQENYTLEAWVKPSHFHRGSFFGLIDWSPKNRNVSHHGLSLELCGPASPWFTDVDLTSLSADELRIPNYHPCSIRFLHRSPPARNAEKGTSCYTPQPYAPRTWQHVVATKAGDHMQLFVNGERVAEGREKTKSPDDMLVLIGQNWPLQFLDKPRDREFVGELDEVAIYNRALSADEILTHYNLVIHQEKPLAPQPEAKLSDLR